MHQNQVVAARLTLLADSICSKCLMSEACEDIPMCGDIKLLKEAAELQEND
ncbi:hypothetical protein SPSIL_040650 [Sporomusa silvacetica DSM 10669]|uniref:Uncharacterized protein n=1 Tax=Sporomusa silvacetica DSM 10669 TaxID=1123289 RepID=A0ABZ3IQM2_9FIRM|nr:hypothetical protein [Sporomusa silvacetica]OZC17176.1 hypothetical protein SPSIL_33380 [Sporomusa silvacetica DSM 10669]